MRWLFIAALAALGLVNGAVAQTVTSTPTQEGLSLQNRPSGFVWNFSSYPLNVYRSPSGNSSVDLQPRASTPAISSIFNGVASGTTGIVYADASAANNSGGATSPTTATQGIKSALAVCEGNSAYTTGCIVYVKSGDYDRTRSLMNSSGSQSGGVWTMPKPTAVICYGGGCTLSENALGLVWTANVTYPSVYQAVRSAVSQDLDRVTNDVNGDPVFFAPQTSIANVNACVATN